MLKWIAQNKYKLMVFIISLYLLVDVLQHKGQTRVLFPKTFTKARQKTLLPQSKSTLINRDKTWKKGVNTKEELNKLSTDIAGFECDVYFDTTKKIFDVHHDADKSIGYNLNELLQLYQQKEMQSSIWLDIKNLGDLNSPIILQSLIKLRQTYHLQNKIIVESGRANLLSTFSDSSFFTSYYIPLFNPYTINKTEINSWADSIASVISKSKVNALSGYYFQSSFLSHYFPKYPVLTWVDNSSFSLVNYFFQRNMGVDKSIVILLKP